MCSNTREKILLEIVRYVELFKLWRIKSSLESINDTDSMVSKIDFIETFSKGWVPDKENFKRKINVAKEKTSNGEFNNMYEVGKFLINKILK